MTEPRKKKSLKQLLCIAAYVLILGSYGMIGAVLLGILLPDYPFALWFVVGTFAGIKMDYKFKGPASSFEQRYVAHDNSQDISHTKE